MKKRENFLLAKQLSFLLLGIVILPFLLVIVQSEVNYYKQILGPQGKMSLAQYTTAKKLSYQTGKLEIIWDEQTQKAPFMLSGPLTQPVLDQNEATDPQKMTEKVINFLKKNKGLYAMKDPEQEFSRERVSGDEIASYLLLQQKYQGLKVVGGELIARFRPNGAMDNLSGHYYSDITLETTPKVNFEQAEKIMEDDLKQTLTGSINYELTVLSPNLFDKLDGGGYSLVWKIEADNWTYFIEAMVGKILFRRMNIAFSRNRVVSLTSSDGRVYCSTLWANENGSVGVPDLPYKAAQDAYQNSQRFYDYFKEKFNYDSFDGLGSPLKSCVGYHIQVSDRGFLEERACNAGFFFQEKFAYFGSGKEDSRVPSWCPMIHASAGVDVVGHEFGHGFLMANGLGYFTGDTVALSEALADFWGEVLEESPDWLHSAVVHVGGVIRNLKDPPATNQPDHQNKSANCPKDPNNQILATGYCKSGIINKVSYLLSVGGTHSGILVEGIGINNVASLYFRTVRYHMVQALDFAGFREKVLLACGELSDWCGESQKASIKNAFAAVGIGSAAPPVTGTPTATPTEGPSPTPTPTSAVFRRSCQSCDFNNDQKVDPLDLTFLGLCYEATGPDWKVVNGLNCQRADLNNDNYINLDDRDIFSATDGGGCWQYYNKDCPASALTPTATPTSTGNPTATPTGPSSTPTPTLTPGGPTLTPTSTLAPGQPTSTLAPTLPPGQPTVTPTRALTSTPTPTYQPPHPTPTITPTIYPGEPVLYLKVKVAGALEGNQPPLLITLKAKDINFSQTFILSPNGLEEELRLTGLTPGNTYDFLLISPGYLTLKKANLILRENQNPANSYLDFGTLRPGDINLDNQVNGLDWSFMHENFGGGGEYLQ